MDEKKQVESLLSALQKCLHSYSISELSDAIVKITAERENKSKSIETVLSIVCSHFNISRRVLIYSAQRKNIQQAKQLTHCLLHFELELSPRYIASKIFTISYRSIYISIEKFRKLDKSIPFDREFLEKYEMLKAKLIENLKQKIDDNSIQQA